MKTPRIILILGLAAVAVAPTFGQALTGTSLSVTGAGASTLSGTLTVTGASTFNNNLTITGWADVMNNQFTLGASSTVFSNWVFADSSVDTLANVLNRGSASWLWAHGTTGSPVPAMRLDSTHQLLLFNAAGTTAGITLTPASNQISLGTATLAGSGANLTVGGALTVTSGITNNTGALTSPTALSLTAGGTNQNITLTPSGTGYTILNGNVGIGTNTPVGRLTISSNAASNNQFMRFENTEAGQVRNWNLGMATASSGAFVLNDLTVGAERLRVTSGGNVGIGTISPGGKLEANGTAANPPSSGTTSGGIFRVRGVNNVIDMGVLNGVNGAWIQAADATTLAVNYSLGLNPNGGNVGIGTTSPGRKLDVNGDANIATNLVVQSGTYTGNLFTLGSGLNIRNASSGNLMYLGETGSVGIGTAAPNAKLEIQPSGGNVGLRLKNTVAATNWDMYAYSDGNFYLNNANGSVLNITANSTNGLLYLTGNSVGVGTSTPAYRFEVLGGSKFYPAAGGDNAVLLNAGGQTVGQSGLAIGYNQTYNGNAMTNSAYLQAESQGVAYRNLLLAPLGGNVGIGTTAPTAKLHISTSGQTKAVFGRDDGAVAENSLVRINTAGASNYSGIGFDAAAAPTSGAAIWMQTNGNGLYFSGSATYANLATAAPHMSITASGNVGIGTTNPTQKLSVAGTIRAYEVIVDTGWADYVFDSNYRLAPLSEVEQHIKTEKHLPGIPSAQEIAEHGVSMGDMQSKLLSKIEEMTLHMIAQEKQMIEQEKSLSARIERLEQENHQLRSASANP